MQSRVRPAAILVKGLLLFAVLEVALVSVTPQLSGISVYAVPVLQRKRFPISTVSPADDSLDVGNLKAMFASHIVSKPKSAGEFRLVVLGDSATWGLGLRAEETMPAQLDGLHLECGGRTIRAYNLSFPRSSATKDLMILDEALSHKPDMIIWMLTWYTLMPKTRDDHFLITQNPDEFYKLGRRFDFLPKGYKPPTGLEAVMAQNRALFRAARFQAYSLAQLATNLDQIAGPPTNVPRELSADPTFEGMKPPTLRRAQVSLDQVQDAYEIAGGIPLVLVNEPILISSGVANSDIRYNNYYPRWVYDQYRQYLGEAAAVKGWTYLDLWNMFPEDYFGDTPLHLTPQAHTLLAEALVPPIEKYCQ